MVGFKRRLRRVRTRRRREARRLLTSRGKDGHGYRGRPAHRSQSQRPINIRMRPRNVGTKTCGPMARQRVGSGICRSAGVYAERRLRPKHRRGPPYGLAPPANRSDKLVSPAIGTSSSRRGSTWLRECAVAEIARRHGTHSSPDTRVAERDHGPRWPLASAQESTHSRPST